MSAGEILALIAIVAGIGLTTWGRHTPDQPHSAIDLDGQHRRWAHRYDDPHNGAA